MPPRNRRAGKTQGVVPAVKEMAGTLRHANASRSFAHPTENAALRRRELQQLDRVEVLHAAADALGRIE